MSITKKKGMALTEKQVMYVRHIILTKAAPDMKNKLYYFFEFMIKTGIRTSDGTHVANAGKRHKKQMFEAVIQKQSKLKDGDGRVYVKRVIKLPDNVYKALTSKKWVLEHKSNSGVKLKTQQIYDLLKDDPKFNRSLSPHDFRHTFIMLAKHRGGDIFDVQAVTKHASLESLQTYYKADTDTIEAVYDSLEKDYFDVSQPALLMKEINKKNLIIKHLEQEIMLLKEGIK